MLRRRTNVSAKSDSDVSIARAKQDLDLLLDKLLSPSYASRTEELHSFYQYAANRIEFQRKAKLDTPKSTYAILLSPPSSSASSSASSSSSSSSRLLLSIWSSVTARLPILLLLLVLQSCSSFILESFSSFLEQNVFVTLYLTMLVGAGGNAGNQATVLMIRALSQPSPAANRGSGEHGAGEASFSPATSSSSSSLSSSSSSSSSSISSSSSFDSYADEYSNGKDPRSKLDRGHGGRVYANTNTNTTINTETLSNLSTNNNTLTHSISFSNIEAQQFTDHSLDTSPPRANTRGGRGGRGESGGTGIMQSRARLLSYFLRELVLALVLGVCVGTAGYGRVVFTSMQLPAAPPSSSSLEYAWLILSSIASLISASLSASFTSFMSLFAASSSSTASSELSSVAAPLALVTAETHQVALAIAVTLMCIVSLSVVVGFFLPLLFYLLKLDPAHSGPTIQVVMDIIGVLVTCLICSCMFDAEAFDPLTV